MNEDGRGTRHGAHHLPREYVKNASTCGMILTEHLLEVLTVDLKTSKRARKSPCNWVRQRKTERKESGQDLWPGRGCEEEGLLAGRRSVGTEGDLGRASEHGDRCAEGKAEGSPAVGAERHTLASNAPTKGAGY